MSYLPSTAIAWASYLPLLWFFPTVGFDGKPVRVPNAPQLAQMLITWEVSSDRPDRSFPLGHSHRSRAIKVR